MKKLQMSAASKKLIESVIVENPKYKGNEELINLFSEEIYKKSYLLIDAIKDQERLKRHLTNICDGCMDQIIKEKALFNQNKVEPAKTATPAPQLNIKIPPQENIKITKPKILIPIPDKKEDLSFLPDPKNYCTKKEISEYTIERFLQTVRLIDQQYPPKKYFKIFCLRYIKHFNQSEIAYELKISQFELAKRFVEMVKLTSEQF